jgi:phage/plasmid-associated DNA primase
MEYHPHHTLVVSLNEDVTLPVDDPAVLERIVSVPFTGKRDDIRVAVAEAFSGFHAEAPAVLHMMLGRARLALADRDYGTMKDAPAWVQALKSRYVAESDLTGMWLASLVTWGPDCAAWTSVEEMHEDFTAWCRRNSERVPPGGTRGLGRKLADHLDPSTCRRESCGKTLWRVSLAGPLATGSAAAQWLKPTTPNPLPLRAKDAYGTGVSGGSGLVG